MRDFFNTAWVDLTALVHNFHQVKSIVGRDTRIMAVVKADAYGHGLERVALSLVKAGADALGVMDLHEAILLRDAGIDRPVFILAGCRGDQGREIIERNVTPFVYDLGMARELDQAAGALGHRLEVHLKIDTGMNRLGVPFARAGSFLRAVKEMSRLRVTGLATHLSEVGAGDGGFAAVQLDRFDEIVKIAGGLGYKLSENNAAASAAILSLPRSLYQMVRPGLLLYGLVPLPRLAGLVNLRPVLSLVSRVVQVKRIEKGDPVSYGRTWVAPAEAILATVPAGYAHGYDRRQAEGGYVLIRGRRAPIRGVVCMNLLMADVTDIPETAVGDEVVLLGAQGREAITAETLAGQARTISYEILCGLGGLNHREYIES